MFSFSALDNFGLFASLQIGSDFSGLSGMEVKIGLQGGLSGIVMTSGTISFGGVVVAFRLAFGELTDDDFRGIFFSELVNFEAGTFFEFD